MKSKQRKKKEIKNQRKGVEDFWVNIDSFPPVRGLWLGTALKSLGIPRKER